MKKVYVMFCILSLLTMGLFTFMNYSENHSFYNAGAENYIQSTSSDLDEGDYIFSKYNNGELKLSSGLVETWNTVGSNTNNRFGYSISSAGDLNGDGYDDIIAGAPYFFANTGAVYVWYGSKNGPAEVTDAQDADWSVEGEGTSQYFGLSAAGAGDLNGDGFDDIIVGAYGYNLSSGKVYVWYGSGAGLTPMKTTDPFTDAANSDWNITGVNQNDYFGFSVSGAGDVNGDGYDDIIVGAYRSNNNYFGSAFIWYGGLKGLTVGTNSIDADWSIGGEAKSYFGYKVSGAGDVNGDGYDDILVGAYWLNTEKGKAYLWYGSSSGPATGSDAGDADWIMNGESSWNRFGRSLSSAGDVNGDGFDDIIISSFGYSSSTGRVYVWYGSSYGISSANTAADADWIMTGPNQGSKFAENVAWTGDVNGDGFDDIFIGASEYRPQPWLVRDRVFLFAGSSAGLIGGANADDAVWAYQSGFTTAMKFGFATAGAGDVNGDGYDDVLTSAYKFTSDTGKVFLYSFGTGSLFSAETDWTASGEGTSDRFGFSVDSAGDVNGDGYEDIIVGSYIDNSNTGKVYVWYGSHDGLGTGSANWSTTGSATNQYFGFSVAGAGDINRDGFDDIIIGAYYVSSGYGRAYVWFGSETGLKSSSNSGDADWWISSNTAGARLGWSVAGAGDVNGDGYDDVIIGAAYDNSKTGKAYLFYGRDNFLVNDDTDADWIMTGETSGNLFASKVDSAGDIDGDGFDDVVVGANNHDSGKGKIYVWYGSSRGLNSSTKADLADWNTTGEFTDNLLGFCVNGIGDANGDGFDDIAATAYGHNSKTGKIYAWYGSEKGLASGTDAGDADWYDVGERPDDYMGNSLGAAGDVNGDGYNDLIAGASIYDSTTGSSYLWLGSPTGFKAVKNAKDADWRKTGENSGDRFGGAVASAGDVNGDGYDDIIVGAHYYSSQKGKVYVWHGSGHVQRGVYDSPVFNLAETANMDWLRLTWDPISQPDGTSVKAHVAVSNDGRDWNFIGPDGTPSSYYTGSGGQRISLDDNGKFLRVRFYLESDFGFFSDAFGHKKTSRTPSFSNYRIEYGIYEDPFIAVTSPNGGEDWMKDDFYPITWNAEGDLNTTAVQLAYTTDNGATWTAIADWIANTGYYNWTVPNVDTPSALIKVTITDVYGNEASDTSDASFAIDPPPVLPGGGDSGGYVPPSNDNQQNNDPVNGPDNRLSSDQEGKADDSSESSDTIGIIVIVTSLVLTLLIHIFLVTRRKEKEPAENEKVQQDSNVASRPINRRQLNTHRNNLFKK
jgi:hypothetical protein